MGEQRVQSTESVEGIEPVKLGDFIGGFHDLLAKETVEKSADLNIEAIAGTNPKLPLRPLPCFSPKPPPLSKASKTLELIVVGLSHTPFTRSFIRNCKIPAVASSLNQQSPLPALHQGLANPSANGLCSLVHPWGTFRTGVNCLSGHRINSN
jgi:hypothetical protein